MNNKLKQFILLTIDILILYISLYLTLWIRYKNQADINTWNSHFIPFTQIFFAWVIVFYISNLYNLNSAINSAKFFNKSFKAITISGLLSISYFYINPSINIAPKTNLFIFLIIFFILFTSWRYLFNRLLYSILPKNRLAIVGNNKQTIELLKKIKNHPHLGYETVLKIDDIENLNLKEKIITKKINTIILVSNPNDSSDLRKKLIKCLPLKINIINFTKFYETITGKVPLEAINQMWFLENLNESNKYFFDFIKRFYDLFLSILLLFITAPLWVIIGIIIKLESKGPIFFKQIRAGRYKKNFTIIKFRTMRTENNNHKPTLENDHRITTFGNFLRKSRLDEIPQILNIILNDMSFIGPRPEQPKLIKKLKKNIPFYSERMLVKPGLSGWDQVSGEYHSPSLEDTIQKLQYDLFYIKNRSIYLDLSIILKTIATILSREGR